MQKPRVLLTFVLFSALLVPISIADETHTPITPPTNSVITSLDLVLGLDRDYAPLSFIEAGQIKGFDVDFARKLNASSSLTVEPLVDDWNRVLQSLENGSIDVVGGIVKSPARNETMDFSIPYLVEHYTVFHRNDLQVSLNQLSNLQGVILRDDISIEHYLKPNHLTDGLLYTSTSTEAFEMLHEGLADFTIAPYSLGRWLIRTHGYSRISDFGRSLFNVEYRYAVKQGRSYELAVINDAISSLMSSGEIQSLAAKWQFFSFFPVSTTPPPSQVLVLLLTGFLGICLGVVAGILIHRVVVKKQIQDFSARHKQFERIINAAPFPIIWFEEMAGGVSGNPAFYDKMKNFPPESSLETISTRMREGGFNQYNFTYPADAESRALTVRCFTDIRELSSLSATVAELSSTLSQKDQQIQELTVRDELTGLFNRHYLYQQIDHEIQLAKRYDHAFSLVLFDIHGFTSINLLHGFDYGDTICKTVASLLSEHLRGTDTIGRVGGGRFLAILPNTGSDKAEITAKKMINQVLSKNEIEHIYIDCSVIAFNGSDRNSLMTSLEKTLKKTNSDSKSCHVYPAF